MSSNDPYRAPGYRLGDPNAEVGCLLIHGFSGGPYDMKFLAQRLSQQGWEAAAPALTGHGEGEASPTRSANGWVACWESDADRALEALLQDRPKVHVAGLSMGSMIAMRLAQRRPEAVRSLLLFAVPLEVASQRMRWPVRLAGAALPGHLVKFKSESDIRQPDSNAPSSRTHMPLGALAALFLLQEKAQRALGRIEAPTLAIHARNDHTAPFSNLERIRSRWGETALETLALEESYHVVTNDIERETVAEAATAFIQRQEERA